MHDKTIAIGVDGMETELFEEWRAAGELPNLTALRESGAGGAARCSSLNSAQQWTTHFTGVRPENHGVKGFKSRVDDTAKDRESHGVKEAPGVDTLINLEDITTKTYPELLDEAGKSTAVVNPLPIWPPLELEYGCCISGLITPPESDRWYAPDELGPALEATDYQIDVQYGSRPYGFIDDGAVEEVPLETMYEDMFAVLDARIEYTKRLMEDRDPEFVYTLLKTIDIIQHVFWVHMEVGDETYGDAILESYRRVDDFVGWVRDAHPDANVVVFGDHGFQRRQTPPPYYLHRAAKFVKRFLPGVPFWFARKYFEVLTSDEEFDVESVSQISGEHDEPAMWIAGGPSVRSGVDADIDFEDVTAMLLAMAGHAVPDAYAGQVPEGVLNCSWERREIDLSVSRRVTLQDSEVVTERLHNLGYAEMVEEES